MADQERGKRKTWTKPETLLFLSCYAERKNEFKNPRKKIIAFTNVMQDMLYRGFNDPGVTPKSLEGRMRTLLGTYNAAKYSRRRTGASTKNVPYWNEMDAIFGDKSINCKKHSGNSGSFPELDGLTTEKATLKSSHSSFEFVGTSPPTSPLTDSTTSSQTSQFSYDDTPSPGSPFPIAVISSNSPYPAAHKTLPTTKIENAVTPRKAATDLPVTRHRKSWKEKYYKKKLLLKMESQKKKLELMETITSELAVIKSIEKEKLRLLRTYFNSKN